MNMDMIWGVPYLDRNKNTMFMRLHPFVNVIYFIVLMLFTMFYQHPVLLGITGAAAFAYSIYMKGIKQLKRNLLLVPMMFLLSFVNPLFNHRGATILFYLNHNPITLESILYGFVAAAMIYDMIVLFSIFHEVMTSDKIICVLSKVMPIGALLFTMTLRFVPMYKAQLVKMRTAQKGIGHDSSQGNVLQKILNGVELVSGLITWALENALDTADSMKGRGFGLTGRTYYTSMKLTKLDLQVLIFEGFCTVCLLWGVVRKAFKVIYFPTIEWYGSGEIPVFFYFVFAAFAIFPIVLDAKEELTWNYWRQKI